MTLYISHQNKMITGKIITVIKLRPKCHLGKKVYVKNFANIMDYIIGASLVLPTS